MSVKAARARGRAAAEPSTFELQPLDPWLACGPDTTVTELWKARERRGDGTLLHLVYLDRYGWYCEHGRNCPAVAVVRRAATELAEVVSGRNAPAQRRSRGKARSRRDD